MGFVVFEDILHIAHIVFFYMEEESAWFTSICSKFKLL